jgi:uncharacterized membrane protein
MATRSLPTALAFALLCAAGASAQEMPRDVTASGNEPFWRVVIEAGDFTLTRPDFQPLILSVTERRTQADGTFVIVSASSSPALRAVLSLGPGPCNDTMADQTYPFTATVALGDNVLTGCGGDPRDLLTASEVWTVTSPARMAHVPADLPIHLLAGIVEIVALGLALRWRRGWRPPASRRRVEARSGARRSAMSSCPRHM